MCAYGCGKIKRRVVVEKFILSIDQGTTSSRAILFDKQGQIRSLAQKEFKQYFPQAGWVEHDPQEIWVSQKQVIADCFKQNNINPDQVAAIGITNQRETIVVWDKYTGEPICPAIVWQCRRTSDFCQQLKVQGLQEKIQSKTGLLLDPYFSASKICWILDNVSGARERAKNGNLIFGTIDSWLIYNLSGKKDHITDPSNASRTMLFNIHEGKWDEELFEIFKIPLYMAPQVVSSSGSLSIVKDIDILPQEVPICGIAGDQQAALFGQGCFQTGQMKNTYGTGCFLLCNTGNTPVKSHHQLLTTVAWKINNEITYCLEGSVFIGGAVIGWIRDELGLIESAAQSEEFARKVEDTAGVYLVPAFAGLGAPHWDSDARGIITGLTRGANKYHIVRAALESIAFQCKELVNSMQKDLGKKPTLLRVDGGATMNQFLMQFQSDLAGVLIERPKVLESTALGAAFLAGLEIGYWKDLGDLPYKSQNTVFNPTKSDEWIEKSMQSWTKALNRAKSDIN